MEQPLGYTDHLFPQHVCRLKRALYGLKQAPKLIHRCLSITLLYRQSIYPGSNTSLIHQFIALLSKEFSLKNLGVLHYFLGVKV
jgi:hypothetical protein